MMVLIRWRPKRMPGSAAVANPDRDTTMRHVLLLIIVLLITPRAPAWAEECTAPPADASQVPASDPAAGSAALAAAPTDDALAEVGIIDRHKRYMDSAVQRGSQNIDAFFAEDIYEAEYNCSQLRLRPELYYRDEQGLEVQMRVSGRLRLPHLNEKVSLVVGSNPEGIETYDSIADDQRESFAGLQLFLKDSEMWNLSLNAGVRTNEFAFFFGPRLRVQNSFNDWSSWRFTQTLRWQTNNFWDIGSRLDLNFLLNQRLHFRQTLDGRWRGEDSDKQGYSTSLGSVLTQRLAQTTGLQYEFRTTFFTQPDLHVDEYLLSLRYRKKTRRDWLYLELAPQVSFEDEFDFTANPGIRLRLEVFYGEIYGRQLWQGNNEDTADFRW